LIGTKITTWNKLIHGKGYMKINTSGIKWWDKYAQAFDLDTDPFDPKNKARKVELDAILKNFLITPEKDPNIVELGSGTGHFVLNFAKKNFTVTGIEISRESNKVLEKRAKKFGLTKKIKIMNNNLNKPIESLKDSFDAGYMISTYHCISQSEKQQLVVLKNFVKLIKKNGKILIMEPNPFNPLYYVFYPFVYDSNLKEGYNFINSSQGKLIKNLKNLGMKQITVYHHSFLPTSFINILGAVKDINAFLCKVPFVNNFSAFNIITAIKE